MFQIDLAGMLALNGVQRYLKKREKRLAAEAEAKRSSAHAACPVRPAAEDM